ncbi:unnamed protein product [Brassica oleracea var. botrytis]
MANSTTQSANSNATKLSPHRTPSDNASECPLTPSSTTHQGNLSLSSMRSSCLIRHTPPYIATRTCSPRLQLSLHRMTNSTTQSANSNATKLSPHWTPSDNASECPLTPSSTTHQGNLSLSLL